MTINVLWIILAVTMGLGTGQSIEGSNATSAEIGCYIDGIWYDNCLELMEPKCWINGIWYNPCPSGFSESY